jgi:transcriptional regulator with XRE-family HTH domain
MPNLFFHIASILIVALEKDKIFLIAFGKNLKKLRKENGLSQAQLAFEANIELSQISRIERGQINTTIANVKLISKILEIPLVNFFDFE